MHNILRQTSAFPVLLKKNQRIRTAWLKHGCALAGLLFGAALGAGHVQAADSGVIRSWQQINSMETTAFKRSFQSFDQSDKTNTQSSSKDSSDAGNTFNMRIISFLNAANSWNKIKKEEETPDVGETPDVSETPATEENVQESAEVPKPEAITAAKLSWTAPAAREDGSSLSMSELTGYRVYAGTKSGVYERKGTVNDAYRMEHTFNDLVPGTYYFTVTAIDHNGLESKYAPEQSLTISQ